MNFNRLPKVFQNKYFLYVVAFVAFGNILGYLAKEEYNSLSFFLAIGLLSSYFSKNMSVVLLISIIATAFFNSKQMIEGMGHMEKEDKKKENKDVEEEAEVEPVETKENSEKSEKQAGEQAEKAAKGEPAPDADANPNDAGVESAERQKEAAAATAAATKMCYKKEGNNWVKTEDGPVEQSNCTGEDKVWGKETFSCHEWDGEKNKWNKKDGVLKDECTGEKLRWCPANQCGEGPQAFTNMKSKNSVAAVSNHQRVDGVDESVGDRIDYSQTVQQAYGNLQQMLGADGMKGLAAETKKLVAQQKELVDSLGQMAPVLNSAKSTLDSLSLPDMKGITSILSTLKASK